MFWKFRLKRWTKKYVNERIKEDWKIFYISKQTMEKRFKGKERVYDAFVRLIKVLYYDGNYSPTEETGGRIYFNYKGTMFNYYGLKEDWRYKGQYNPNSKIRIKKETI